MTWFFEWVVLGNGVDGKVIQSPDFATQNECRKALAHFDLPRRYVLLHSSDCLAVPQVEVH